jgi:hypothetical protein
LGTTEEKYEFCDYGKRDSIYDGLCEHIVDPFFSYHSLEELQDQDEAGHPPQLALMPLDIIIKAVACLFTVASL